MVQAMVETHTRGSRDSKRAVFDQRDTVSMDLVKGKGKYDTTSLCSINCAKLVWVRQGMYHPPPRSTRRGQDVDSR